MEKIVGMEDLGFFPMIQGLESLVDDGPQPLEPLVKNNSECGQFVDDILEEIEIDNGCGLDLQSDWLSDRVDLTGFELGFSGLADFGLAGDFDTPSFNVVEDNPSEERTGETCSIDLGALLVETVSASPLSPEQCVPDFNYVSPVPSPGNSSVSSACDTSTTASSPTSPCSPPPVTETNIGAILSDSVKVSKTVQNREKANSIPKQYKVQAKVKTVTQKKRKQVQNRDAATRYRVKKKEEQDVLFNKAEELEKENSELSGTVATLTQEIEYLRKLMVEVYKARLLKSLPSA